MSSASPFGAKALALYAALIGAGAAGGAAVPLQAKAEPVQIEPVVRNHTVRLELLEQQADQRRQQIDENYEILIEVREAVIRMDERFRMEE